MTAERDDILRKVRACLALSASQEPHEAAAAMRQAEALMRRHGLDRAEVEQSVVEEREVTAGRSDHLAIYLRALAATVGDVMGCRYYVSRPRTVAFVGVGPAAEIAAYAYQVLGRQLIAARAVHRRRRTRGEPHKRTARADAWAVGWVAGVRALVGNLRPGVPEAVQGYMQVRHPHLVPSRAKRHGADTGHLHAGYAAGRTSGVRLHHGVPVGERPREIGT